MPYKTIQELPNMVKENLPEHGQEIFKEAYNSAWEEYKNPDSRRGDESREEVSMKVAWSAVHSQYHKDEKGNWVSND